MPQQQSKPKRGISVSVLPGEPTDGGGRVCIHLFVQDEAGPMVEPHALHPPTKDSGGQLVGAPTRGRLACGKVPLTKQQENLFRVTIRTDDPRATTCPACKSSDIYKLMMEKLKGG